MKNPLLFYMMICLGGLGTPVFNFVLPTESVFAQVAPCYGDMDPDLVVDGRDLYQLIAEYGRTDCSAANPCKADLDHDSKVGELDLLSFLDDFTRTDCKAESGPAQAWYLALSAVVNTSPAITADGKTIYVASNNTDINPTAGRLYAIELDADGDPITGSNTAFFTGTDGVTAPVIDSSGNIYVGAGKALYAFRADRTLKFSVALSGGTRASKPVIGPNGNIYVSIYDNVQFGKLYCIQPDGTLNPNWGTNPVTLQFFDSTPVLTPDGSLVIAATHSQRVYALRTSDGDYDANWSTSGVFIGASAKTTPGVGPGATAKGTVYIAGSDERVYALSGENGSTLLTSAVIASEGLSTQPVVSGETLYIGSYDDHLYALSTVDLSSKAGFPFYAAGNVQSTPAVDSEGTVYFGSDLRDPFADNQNVNAIYSDGTVKWRFSTRSGDVRGTPALKPDGTVYIGSFNSNFYAITPSVAAIYDSVVYSGSVASLINLIQQTDLQTIVNQMTGAATISVGGNNYTLTSRRTTSGTEIDRATQWAYEQLQAAGWSASYQNWSYGGYTNRNVIGTKTGTLYPNSHIIVSAHIDGYIPGAEDNASGIAMVIAMARALSGVSLYRTVDIVLTTGEEENFWGIYAYGIGLSSCYAAIFADAVGYDSNNDSHCNIAVYGGGIDHTPTASELAMVDLIQNVNITYSIGLVPVAGKVPTTDAIRFWQGGSAYPAVCLHEDYPNDTSPYMHGTGDLPATLNFPFLTKHTKLMLGSVIHFAGHEGVK